MRNPRLLPPRVGGNIKIYRELLKPTNNLMRQPRAEIHTTGCFWYALFIYQVRK